MQASRPDTVPATLIPGDGIGPEIVDAAAIRPVADPDIVRSIGHYVSLADAAVLALRTADNQADVEGTGRIVDVGRRRTLRAR